MYVHCFKDREKQIDKERKLRYMRRLMTKAFRTSLQSALKRYQAANVHEHGDRISTKENRFSARVHIAAFTSSTTVLHKWRSVLGCMAYVSFFLQSLLGCRDCKKKLTSSGYAMIFSKAVLETAHSVIASGTPDPEPNRVWLHSCLYQGRIRHATHYMTVRTLY